MSDFHEKSTKLSLGILKGKSPNSSISIRYSINEDKLEEIFSCDEDPPTPQTDNSPVNVGDGSPRKAEKGSILEKYFKSGKVDKSKSEAKPIEDSRQISELITSKSADTESGKSTPAKDVSASPMKDVLNRLSKRTNSHDVSDPVSAEPPTETWKIFHDFKYKWAQAVEEMKSSRTGDSQPESKEKVVRDNSVSDSEENSLARECDQQSLADTDNQMSSLESSMQNLSEIVLPSGAGVRLGEVTFTQDRNESSESNDDTQKNIDMDALATKDMEDSFMEVESGIEALEETSVDAPHNADSPCVAMPSCSQFPLYTDKERIMPTVPSNARKGVNYFLNPFFIMFSAILVLSILVCPKCKLWLGFVMGLWLVSLFNCTKCWLLTSFGYADDTSLTEQLFNMINVPRNVPILAVPNIKEHRPIKKLEGWVNQYRFPEYDPMDYHIGLTTTVFMKLEGHMLRISYTHAKVPKKALWNEQIEVSNFYQHRIYNLAKARVILLPKGIVAKRLWSKKYPICIILNPTEQVQILEKENQEKKTNDADKNKTGGTSSLDNSPTMKKKFIWKLADRKVKMTQPESPEPGREGLRKRISRKLHKDKKPEDASIETKESALSYDECCSMPKAETETIEEVAHTARINFDENTDVAEVAKLTELLEDAETDSGSVADSPPVQEQWTYVKKDAEDVNTLFLFARTGREKFEWYIQIKKSIIEWQEQQKTEPSKESSQSEQVTYDANLMEMTVIKANDKDGNVSNEKSKQPENNSPQHNETQRDRQEKIDDGNCITYEKEFWTYMYKIMQNKSGPSSDESVPVSPEAPWVNLMVARVAYDALRSPYWMRRLQDRIQRKLETLRLPSFMGPLVVTELDGGEQCPVVRGITEPHVDERGVWLQLDVSYTGTATITIVSQLNLMKLKYKKLPDEDMAGGSEQSLDDSELPHHVPSESTNREAKVKLAIFNADMDDSAESSSDDESLHSQAFMSDIPPDAAVNSEAGPPHPSSTKRFLKFVDKITSSKYFQHISDYKYVKRAMEGLSNTDIKLTLELKALSGILAVNIPPPPHDRVWIGFRSSPHMWLRARPGVGSLALRFTHITSLIESKLCKEFEKVIVMPNMEDFTIELMTPTPVDFE